MIQKHAAKAAREHPEKPTYSFKPQINDSYFVSGTILRIELAHAVVRRLDKSGEDSVSLIRLRCRRVLR